MRAAAEPAIVDVLSIYTDEPGPYRHILVGIFVENMPEMSPSNHHGYMVSDAMRWVRC